MLKKRWLVYIYLIGSLFSMGMSVQAVHAAESQLQLTQKIGHTKKERETIVQLSAQGMMETVNVHLSKGMKVNVEQTLVQNIDEIDSIKELNNGFQIKFVKKKQQNEKLDLYIETDQNVASGTVEAEQNKTIYSNKLALTLLDRRRATKQAQPTGPLVKENEQWNEVSTGRAELNIGEVVIYANVAGGGFNSARPILYKKGKEWSDLSLSGDLIINNQIVQLDSLPNFSTDPKVDMFNSRRKSNEKKYVNSEKNKLLIEFKVDGKYDIQLLLSLTNTGDIYKSYAITNKSGVAVKIGLTEVLNHSKQVYDSDYAFVPHSGDLINSKAQESSTSLLIQWQRGDFENWAYGTNVSQFGGYTPDNESGVGIEQPDAGLNTKGKWTYYAYSSSRATIAGKTLGRQVENNETIKLSNKMHISATPPPVLTLTEKSFTVGHGNTVIQLNGTAYDQNSNMYRLMYYDVTDKKSMVVKSFKGKAGSKVNIANLTADLGDLSVGDHTGNFYLLNELELGNEPIPVKIKVLSVGGKPRIQKVEVGDSFDKKLDELFTEVSGDQVTMTQLKKPDTSKIGFSKAVGTLQDSLGQKIDVSIPVNIYNKDSTTFYDKDEIAVDGVKEAAITVGELGLSEDWDNLIKEKTSLDSWDMRTGEKYTPELKDNDLQNIPGAYNAHFSINKPEHSIIHAVTLQVTGFLEFEHVPDFDFGTVKIPEKTTMVPRSSKEQIIINDERGPNKNWQLTAMLTQESKDAKHKLGSLKFVYEDGRAEVMEPNDLILVKIGETQKTSLQPLEWQENTGLLFELSPGSYSGEYSGKIDWTLEDVPSDN